MRGRYQPEGGGRGGTWIVLMDGVARLVGEKHPGIRTAVVEGGGVVNHSLVGIVVSMAWVEVGVPPVQWA
ncbi:MAG: hypothetical protein IIB16_07710 [Chloroflexi bacterium]|nr:hypothetical protein [Chloroflexota bacterium]